jgi:hypothetical protein
MVVDVAVPVWVYYALVWSLAWSAVASWKAARKGHLVWFISFFIFLNYTFGILPIIYIFIFQNFKFSEKPVKKVSKKKRKKVKKFPTLS